MRLFVIMEMFASSGEWPVDIIVFGFLLEEITLRPVQSLMKMVQWHCLTEGVDCRWISRINMNVAFTNLPKFADLPLVEVAGRLHPWLNGSVHCGTEEPIEGVFAFMVEVR